jgi:5-dehydro-2-deoxygluconokinase
VEPDLTPSALDLVCMGRVAVDFYAEQVGAPLRQAQSFRMYLGGCAGNVAVGASRMGLSVAMLSRVGADELGAFLRETLEREGVATDLLVDDPERLSGLVVLGVAPPDRFPLIFYRERCADMAIDLAAVDHGRLAAARALMVTGTGLSQPASAAATRQAVGIARAGGARVVFDLDYRPVLWGLAAKGDGETRYRAAAGVTAALQALVPEADLVVGTDEELAIAGGAEPAEGPAGVDAAVERVRALGTATVVRKLGPAGCRIYPHDGEPFDVPGLPVAVLNVLGAGDAFLGGFFRGWLRGEDLATCGRWGNAAGALVVSRHGCAPAMPTFAEVEWFLAQPEPRSAVHAPELARLHRRAALPPARDLFVLAFDHRDQLEASADALDVPRDHIAAFKELVWRGFAMARGAAGGGAAVLVDPIHGAGVLAAATAAGVPVGAPIERAGSCPVEWLGAGSLDAQVAVRPPRWWVKVLVHLHPAMAPDLERRQVARLCELQETCDRHERASMVELVAPPGLRFAGDDLARTVGRLYAAGIEPTWWKVPPPDDAAWRALVAAIDAAGSAARVVVLGGGEPLEVLSRSFRVARSTPHGAGFAVGRSIFWDAWERFARGEATAEAVVAEVAERYGRLAAAWREAAA